MIIAEVLASIMGAYFTYMLQKIDKRQDKIEIDVEVIKQSLYKRKDDPIKNLTIQ